MKFFIIFFCLLTAGNISAQNDAEEADQNLFFIGGLAHLSEQEKEEALKRLEATVPNNESSTIIFIGDNFQLNKRRDMTAEEREKLEKEQLKPFKFLKDFEGEIIFIPGDMEWLNGKQKGWENVQYVEEVVEKYFDNDNIFLPNIGCPQPAEVELGDDILLLALNTSWWMHHYDKPITKIYECDAGNDQKFVDQVDELIERYQDKIIVLAGYHPILTDHSKAFNYRMYEFEREMKTMLGRHKNVIYLAGNSDKAGMTEKDFVDGDIHQIIALAGDAGGKGIGKLTIKNSGTVNFSFVNDQEEHFLYKKEISELPEPGLPEYIALDPKDYSDSVKIVAAGDYNAGALRKLFLGKHYRKEWNAPVEMEYLDLKNDKGGLVPIEQGGGRQTKSLRLKGGDGYIYNIRSIDKDPSEVLPDVLRNTVAASILQDQISSAHPYGAFVVPPLADAAGVYHTAPELVYVPNTPLLGRYQAIFGDMPAMIEIRPDEDLSEFARFGNSTNLVSSRTMYEQTTEDNDDEVDARHFARARLFDILLGDWDRHEDQWRWAEFDKEKGELMQAVPRDRDQVFVKMDGLLPWIANRKWAVRELSHFSHNYHDIIGLTKTGTYLDRRYLSELTREDWQQIADSMKNSLTDNIIEKAVKNIPENAYKYSGNEITAKLKSRRDALPEAAEEYYELLAKEVDIVGSDKHEYFDIEINAQGQLQVTMYKTSKEREVKKQLYKRTFDKKDTREVRIYSLGGNDSFKITGNKNPGIKIRILGGDGDDVLINDATAGKILFYDYRIFSVSGKGTTREIIYEEPRPNEYDNDRKPVNYNYVAPVVKFGYNPDDGIFVGGGVNIKTFGFRKEPFSTSHILAGNYAFQTSAFNVKYEGLYIKALGNWDLGLLLEGNFPNYVSNFTGFGNNTSLDPDKDQDFYDVRYDLFTVEPAFIRRLNEIHSISIKPSYQFAQLEQNKDKFIYSLALTEENIDLYERQHYGGVHLKYNLDSRNSKITPYHGWNINLGAGYNYDLLNGSDNFTDIFGDVSIYLTGYLPLKTTLALRVGGAANFGEYQFYQAQYLGGYENLRGYIRDRFAGDYKTFQNTDLRINIFEFNTYLLSGDFGILLFNDFGRVWLEEEQSDKWHHGYGGGIWIAPFNVAVLTASYGIGEEDAVLHLKFGYFF